MEADAIQWTTSPTGIGVSLFTYLLMSFTLMVCAGKLGLANPWFAFVPFLNLWYATQIAGVEWWWTILFFVPCVNLIASIYVMWRIFERRRKNPIVSLAMFFPCINILAALYVCSD